MKKFPFPPQTLSFFSSLPSGLILFLIYPHTLAFPLAFVGVSHRGNTFPRFQCLRHNSKILLIPNKPTVFHSRVPAKFPVFCRAFSAWSLREKIIKMERQDAAPPKKICAIREICVRNKTRVPTFPRSFLVHSLRD